MKVGSLITVIFSDFGRYIFQTFRDKTTCDLISFSLTPKYTVSQKNCANLFFCQNCVKFRPIVKIFGIEIAMRTRFSVMYLFSTSPYLCQRTTALNADVPNCYITL